MNSISRYTFVNTLIFIKKGLIKTFFRAGSFLRTKHFIMYGNAFPSFPSPPPPPTENSLIESDGWSTAGGSNSLTQTGEARQKIKN